MPDGPAQCSFWEAEAAAEVKRGAYACNTPADPDISPYWKCSEQIGVAMANPNLVDWRSSSGRILYPDAGTFDLFAQVKLSFWNIV
jgi:hypothetical protein